MREDVWVAHLASSLGDKSHYVSDGHILTLISVLEDLGEWLRDSRTYSAAFHRRAWDSVISDFEDTVGSLGSSLMAVILTDSDSLSTILQSNNLRTDPTDTLRSEALGYLESIIAKLSEQKSLIAAWKDLIQKAKSSTGTTEEVNFLRDVFIEIAIYQELNVDTMGLKSKLVGILNDSHYAIIDAEDKVNSTPYRDYRDVEEVSHSIDDRLKLCVKVLKIKPENSHNIVWLEIKRASMDRSVLKRGDVTFYESKCLLAKSEINDKDLPEISNRNGRPFPLYNFESNGNNILARVDLGLCSAATAVEKAQFIVKGMVQLVGIRKEDWVIGGSYIIFQDGFETQSGFNRSKQIDLEYNHFTDSVAFTMESEEISSDSVAASNVDRRLGEALRLKQLLRDARADDEDNLKPMLAATRMLEHVTAWATDDKKWFIFAEQYISKQWARHIVIRDMENAVTPIVHSGLEINGVVNEQFLAIKKAIVSPHGRNGFLFNRQEAIKYLRELSDINHLFKQGQNFDELVEMYSTGQALRKALAEKEANFIKLMARLVRHRNSAEHGGPRAERVANNITTFASEIAYISIGTAISTFLTGGDIQNEYTIRDQRLTTKFEALARGAEPHSLLG